MMIPFVNRCRPLHCRRCHQTLVRQWFQIAITQAKMILLQ
uniref:Uncharacterized protein n=1 Tax=Rhizophora mucronata TaxID=61149 RepID=A0A2P2NZ85_RHIMU